MRASEIRRSFVEYFTERQHREVPSSPLVPAGDPTLLFTNAGMVQFKRVFQGLEQRDYRRAVTVQKCVRAGGKHNDLEQVGHTARHHTFFEMLGNFSFGDYFKRDAIAFGWEWVTSERYLGIHPDRIYVSVHHSDDEARRLWREVTGIADTRIYGLGDKDNFWQMGDTGPCGPCSEIYVDLRVSADPPIRRPADPPIRRSADPPTMSEFLELTESGQLLEIWNLVFMQFDQAADGSRTPLPAPSVDTGAGLERIAAVMQRVDSNFDTDLFTPIIRRGVEIIGRPYDQGPAGAGFRVLADHARAVAFLLADGVYPSNEGRGYVLRRILRRAVRHAFLLGRKDPTLVDLAAVVVETMGDVYPELRSKAQHIASVTRAEEERFLATIEDGLRRLDEIITGSSGTVSGDDAFKLYDTYGFPVDLTQLIAAERGWSVDVAGFERALSHQQERSRRARKASHAAQGRGGHGAAAGPGAPAVRRSGGRGGFTRVRPRVRQRFVGYEATKVETDVLAFRQTEDQLELVLHENPFYAESGGQVSDTGVVKGQGWELPVSDVRKVEGLQVLVGPWSGPFEPTPVAAIVAEERRRNIERNHSATHLVHAALRQVLGVHVRQAGSVVAPDRLRFDFSHHHPVSDEELRAIEEVVNQGVWANVDVETYQMSYADAIAAGAMALFGEKYGDRVRVVDMPGISKELCGGTHVRTTGQIGLFHFTSESGVAAGVRRIEAVTGPGAYAAIRELDERLSQAAETLRTNPEHLAARIEALLAVRRRLEKQIEELVKSGAAGAGAVGSGEEHRINGTLVVVGDAPVPDREQIGMLMDAFREKQHNAVQVLFVRGDRPGVHVGVTDDLISRGVRAGELASGIAAVSGGRGGG
ncbi:MAG TPA: alanine--tRNA ligase, partial [Gemmatimonadales bacterium]|nr:alanine--tRNA ligase [Gemmatimonadales bacterium]